MTWRDGRAGRAGPSRPGPGLHDRKAQAGPRVAECVDRALEADPLSGLAGVAQAFFQKVGRPAEHLLTAAHRGVQLRPDRALGYWGPALASLTAGKAARAIAALRRALELSDGGIVMRAQLAWALARTGGTDEARAILSDLEGLGGNAYESPYQLAVVGLALGEREVALGELERAAEGRDPWIVLLAADAALAALHGEPRFDRLVARVQWMTLKDRPLVLLRAPDLEDPLAVVRPDRSLPAEV